MSLFRMTGTIFGNLFRRYSTRLYPFVIREPYARTRGRIVIDIEACSLCTLCAKRCPAQALVVDRVGKRWEIDPYRCVMCNICVDICPKKCLVADTHSSPVTPKKSTQSHVQAPKEIPNAPAAATPSEKT